MATQLVAALQPAVSHARLMAYRSTSDDDLAMLVNYFHNIELSEALYPVLQAFEIALRNTIHATLSNFFGTELWFDTPNLLLTWQQAALQNARAELSRHGRRQEAGRIVAELNFGFWHSMFNRPYEARVWHVRGAVLLATAFPHLPRKLRTRQAIWDRCDQIRRLRNRVFHYEPIWNRSTLAAEHALILEALEWINPAMRAAIALCDRFPVAHADGAARLTIALRNWGDVEP